MAGKERKVEAVMIHDPRRDVGQVGVPTMGEMGSRGGERNGGGEEEGAGKVVGEGGERGVQILLERFGATWFRKEGKGRLVAGGEEFSQWLTVGGGPEIELTDISHFRKLVDVEREGKVIELCRLEDEVIPV